MLRYTQLITHNKLIQVNQGTFREFLIVGHRPQIVLELLSQKYAKQGTFVFLYVDSYHIDLIYCGYGASLFRLLEILKCTLPYAISVPHITRPDFPGEPSKRPVRYSVFQTS